MEVAGISLAVLAEVRQLAFSMKDRWKDYEDGPRRFAAVERAMSHLLSVVNEIDAIVKANPEALPAATARIFRDTMHDVQKDIARSCDE